MIKLDQLRQRRVDVWMTLENCMSCCYSTSSGCKLQFAFLQIEEMQQGTLTAQQKGDDFNKDIFG